MKKIICIALAAVMALSLAACGGNNGLSGKVATGIGRRIPPRMAPRSIRRIPTSGIP